MEGECTGIVRNKVRVLDGHDAFLEGLLHDGQLFRLPFQVPFPELLFGSYLFKVTFVISPVLMTTLAIIYTYTFIIHIFRFSHCMILLTLNRGY